MARAITDQDTLRSLIERMVQAREAMNVQRDLLNDFRRDARSDGLNMQALNPLVDILGEQSHDRGSKVLSDLLSYARAAGTELDLGDGPLDTNKGPTAIPAKDDGASQVLAMGPAATAAGSAPGRSSGRGWMKSASHGALAIFISGALLWLLN
jgi:hypothetical protein